MMRYWTAFLVCLTCCAGLVRTLDAGSLEAELDLKARAIAAYMKQKGFNEATLSPIGGIAQATGTNRIAAVLEEKLNGHQIALIGAGAPVILDVEIALGVDEAILTIEIDLKTDRGQKLRDWTGEFEFDDQTVEVNRGSTFAEIDNADDVQVILGTPVSVTDLPPGVKDAEKKILRSIAENFGKSESFLDQTRVSSDADQLYQLEIVKTDDPNLSAGSYQSLPLEQSAGFANVDLNRGDRFGVRIYNNSPKAVAVEICLDGINSFHFSSFMGRHYRVEPNSSILVRGFHEAFDRSTGVHTYRHFAIVDYADSAWLKAQQSGFQSQVDAQGAISAHFSHEIPGTRGGDTSNQPDLIGAAEQFRERAKVVKMNFGPVFETAVVRYKKPR